MTDSKSELANKPDRRKEHANVGSATMGMSPYATGGGGVTFERRVAVKYLAHLLVGDGATELGDGRSVVSVSFQQGPDHPVDDLVIAAAYPGDNHPSLFLSLGVRRSPNLVQSDEPTRKLIREFVRAVINAPAEGPERRLGLVVAGPQTQAQQLGELADLAADQMEAPGFSDLVRTPNKFSGSIVGRLDHIEQLVKRALQDLGVSAEPGTALVQQHTWKLLSGLVVLMPRLETPDETDWSAVENSLVDVARSSDLAGASKVRDRLVELASIYPPKAARVNLSILRRDAHSTLDPTVGRHQQGWQVLGHLEDAAFRLVSNNVNANDGARSVHLDRSAIADELVAITAEHPAVVVSGESGVGKSALALGALANSSRDNPDTAQAQCINLRQVPKLSVDFETALGCPLVTLLSELSAPLRTLIIDGADAIAEGMEDAFCYMVDAAKSSEVNIVAVTAADNAQVVKDILSNRFGPNIATHTVPPLNDSEILEIIDIFPELENLNGNPQSRELLRRLVVVDLLVRGGITGMSLSDADAMQEIWSSLVRRRGLADRGQPDVRELVLLRLADCSLRGGERHNALVGLEPTALAGLRQDGLLQTSDDNPFMIGPDFVHDEVRRYSVARLLLSENAPASELLKAKVPRWALGAAKLACQAILQAPDSPSMPLRGRFRKLQSSFQALVESGHGARWGDVPGEALVAMSDPTSVLTDAWPYLRDDEDAGLRRIARIVDQRLRNDTGTVNPTTIEPIITLLLEEDAPWRSGKHASNLLLLWLHGHIAVKTPSGHPTRTQLRERLAKECAEADRRLREQRMADSAAQAAGVPEDVKRATELEKKHPELFVSELDYFRSHRRERPEVPWECSEETFLQLVALLGPDLGDDGKAILLRIAHDDPSSLAPVVEDTFAAVSLSQCPRGLLAQLTEAYYLKDETEGYPFEFQEEGIRGHDPKYGDVMGPLAAWYLGPFTVLFNTDFQGGVAVLNRLLNQAALVRARRLARLDSMRSGIPDPETRPYQIDLQVTGACRTYLGDKQVWYWYRGTGVGPYPCISGLQALERVCDELIKLDIPVAKLVAILLEGCENLAMVGLTVGILVRHLETSGNLLDPYFVEPLVWDLEVQRVVQESSILAANSEGIYAPDRRHWSLREAAMASALHANDERANELRMISEALVQNARYLIDQEILANGDNNQAIRSENVDTELAAVKISASCLVKDEFQWHETPNGIHVQASPPKDAVQELQHANRINERVSLEMQLSSRYFYKTKETSNGPAESDEIQNDIASARALLEDPTPLRAHHPCDVPAAVAAAALEAHLLHHVELQEDTLGFAAGILLRVSEGKAFTGLHEFEESYFEQGADRSAARVLPLLLTPDAARLRAIVDGADGSAAFARASAASVNLAKSVVNEVRLHLARGLDHLWVTPCVETGHCHHQVAWKIATETMRDCAFSDWHHDAPYKKRGLRRFSKIAAIGADLVRRIFRRPTSNLRTGPSYDAETRNLATLEEPLAQSLDKIPDGSIRLYRLDASIRALASAATTKNCVSTAARDLLAAILNAQQRSLAHHQPGYGDPDWRGTHALIAARALLTLAQHGDDAVILEHINGYADQSVSLNKILMGLSAAAEETQQRASTARRIWPALIRHVLDLNDHGHTPFDGRSHGDLALSALLPKSTYSTQYLYQELRGEPIIWWDPREIRSEVEAWLVPATGNASCVDQLISFLRVLTTDEQAELGLPWMATLVLARPGNIANRTFHLADWLIETRGAAESANLSNVWLQIVDALVVEGDARLAPYSV